MLPLRGSFVSRGRRWDAFPLRDSQRMPSAVARESGGGYRRSSRGSWRRADGKEEAGWPKVVAGKEEASWLPEVVAGEEEAG